MQPSVCILVPTYGRTRVLRECLYSFQAQDYAGALSMVVLNDHPEQQLSLAFEDSRISIINSSTRYSDTGSKRNALLTKTTAKLVAFWDDDDIYLPSAVSRMVERYTARLAQKRRSGRESHCWQLQAPHGEPGVGGVVAVGDQMELIIRDSGTLWSMITERSAILDVSGFPHWDRKQDVDLLRKLTQAGWVGAESNTPGIPSCIHRRTGTPYTHSVDFTEWKGPQHNDASSAYHAAATTALMDLGEEPRGNIAVDAAWSLDWTALTKAAWDSNPDRQNVPRLGAPPTHF